MTAATASERQPHRYSGSKLVWFLYLPLIALTLLTVWVSIRHPKTREFREGTFLPMAKCEEILSSETVRIQYLNQGETLRFLGVQGPASAPGRLPEARNPAREEDIARQILQGWIYKRQMKIFFPGGDPQAVVRDDEGVLLAYAELYGVDVGGKMIKEGQALAIREPHPRSEAYQRWETAARDARKGLFREP